MFLRRKPRHPTSRVQKSFRLITPALLRLQVRQGDTAQLKDKAETPSPSRTRASVGSTAPDSPCRAWSADRGEGTGRKRMSCLFFGPCLEDSPVSAVSRHTMFYESAFLRWNVRLANTEATGRGRRTAFAEGQGVPGGDKLLAGIGTAHRSEHWRWVLGAGQARIQKPL